MILCHQREDRSPKIFNKRFPLCYRCTGITIGALAGFLLSLSNFYLLFLIPMPLDGITQRLKLRKSNNTLRFITGLLFGISINISVRLIKNGL